MRQLILIITCICGLTATGYAQSKEDLSSTQAYSQNIEKKVITIDLKNAFNASPIIYSILLGLSLASMTIALNAFMEINKKLSIPSQALEKAKEKLISCRYDEAVD